jgi:hypothetical protein
MNYIYSEIVYVSKDLEEKKLLGSGGYAFAKITEQQGIKSSLEFFTYS